MNQILTGVQPFIINGPHTAGRENTNAHAQRMWLTALTGAFHTFDILNLATSSAETFDTQTRSKLCER